MPSFKSINSSSLSRKKYIGGNFTHTLCQRLRGQNTLLGIWLIKLTEPSETLNYIPFSKHYILQFYLYFYCLYLCGTKPFVLKTELYFIFFYLVWGGIWCYSFKDSVLLLLFLWGYRELAITRYNLLEMAIKTVL